MTTRPFSTPAATSGEDVTPKRIRLSRKKGWRMPANAVKVDRSTKWGNPFVVGRDGNAAQCVHLYRMLMAGNICLTRSPRGEDQIAAFNYARENIASLKGKNLACWCAASHWCHADVLLEMANK